MNIKDFNKEAIKEALKELKGLEMKVTDADGDEICVYHESTEVMINDLIPKNNKKLIDEIVGEVEGMNKEPIPELEGADARGCYSYNCVLDDLITKLKELKDET